MKYLGDNQYVYEYALPDIFNSDSGGNSLVMNVINMLREEGTIKILNLVM